MRKPAVLFRCVVFVLCGGFFALPDTAPALTGTGSGGDGECVRFKAGHEVKSGDCVWTIGVTEEWDVMFNDEEQDPKRFGMSYSCRPDRSDLPDEEADKLPKCTPQVYPLPASGGKHCAETDVMPGEQCAFTLDGKPAVLPEYPPKPAPAWFCLEKTGTDEVMCLKREERE